jgi:hypothetical protein
MPKVRIVKQGADKRTLSLQDFVEDKNAAKAYAKEFAHIAPNRLEFMERVSIWEGVYIPMREKEGWVSIKGVRNALSTHLVPLGGSELAPTPVFSDLFEAL